MKIRPPGWFMVFILLACSPTKPPHDTLVVLVEAPIGDLDPSTAITAYGLKISRLVHEPLVSLDTPDGQPKFELLDRIETPDPLTAILHLRPDVRFSDGTSLTARDVVHTLNAIREGRFSPFAGKWRDLVELRADSDRVVFLRFSAIRPTLVSDLDIGIVKGGGPTLAAGRPQRIGAGPFVLESRTTDRIVLRRNPHYYKGRPPVARVVFQTVEEENIRALLMSSGHGDLSQNNISPILLPALAHLPLQRGPSWTLTYLGFNAQVPQLADPRVRRALALAVDRERLVQARFRGTAQLADSIMPPQHWAHAPKLPQLAYDPAAAARLLDEAGYPADPRTGVRFSLEYKTSSNPFRVAIAKVIAEGWGRIGVRVRVRSLEWGVFFADIKKRQFQVMSLQMPEIGVPDVMVDFFHSANIPSAVRPDGVNRWGYADAGVDELLDRTRRTSVPAARQDLFNRVQEKLMRDLPIFPLWFEENLVFLSTRVREYNLLPNARWSSLSRVVLRP
jgi:peptide/nickel transport system substrate-binding protein